MKREKVTKEIDYIVNQIVRKYRPLKIILFGSAARGEFDRLDDLDFLIIKDDVPSRGLERMRQLDELIDRNMAADMLIYRQQEIDERLDLGDPFIIMLLKEGQVLFG